MAVVQVVERPRGKRTGEREREGGEFTITLSRESVESHVIQARNLQVFRLFKHVMAFLSW